MIFSTTAALLLAAQGVFANPLKNEKREFPPGIAFNWGGDKLRGVNLGGW